MTNIAGIHIPSTSPIFLAIVALHVLLGLACVLTGAVAMLSPKQQGRHPNFGTIYFWCLSGAVALAIGLSLVRWSRDYPLFILGILSFAAALTGRTARRQSWSGWIRWHISGMGIVVCAIADGLLRGQRKEPPPVEGPSDDYLLASPRCNRDSYYRPRAAPPSLAGRIKG